jgi:hypothetical protein
LTPNNSTFNARVAPNASTTPSPTPSAASRPPVPTDQGPRATTAGAASSVAASALDTSMAVRVEPTF